MSHRFLVGLTALLFAFLIAAGAASAHPPAQHSGPAEEDAMQQAPTGDPVGEEAETGAGTGEDANAHTGSHAHDAAANAAGNADHQDMPGTEAGHHDPAGAAPCDDGHAAPHMESGAAAAPAGGHAHWGDHGPQSDLERAIARLGALHSVAVHFPIALMLAAALAQILAWMRPGTGFGQTVRFLAWTAALGGLGAGLLGWAHAGPMATGESGIMAAHRWIGTALTAGLFAVAVLVELRSRRPGALTDWLAGTAILAGAALVAVNGFLGGSLAHGGLRHLMGG